MDIYNTYFRFFIHDTYFGTIPKELFYVVLSNLEMKDVCDVFGYDFYKMDKWLFDVIIKRDFDRDILTNLIDTTSLNIALSSANLYTGKLRYNSFLYKFKLYMTGFNAL